MEIISNLKSRIGASEEDKISKFLGESNEAVSRSFGLSLNAMLGGLKEIAQKDGNADRILKVINDGGHSGDLTDDLARVFNNPDKVQLLITIGKNINNHFFNSGSGVLADKIAELGAISKTSASSLLSLSAPLILGVLGKQIKVEGLNAAGFNSLLKNASLNLEPDTSKTLMSSLGFTGTMPVVPSPVVKVQQQIVEENAPRVRTKKRRKREFKEENDNADNSFNWVAWFFLAVLGLAALYYAIKDKYLPGQQTEEIVSLKDSAFYKTESDIFDNLNTGNQNSSDSNAFDVPKEVDTKVETKVRPTFKEEVVPAVKNNERATRPAPVTQSQPSSTNFPKENTASTPVPVREESEVTDTRPMSVKLKSNGSFVGINGLSFKNNGAEVQSKGALTDVVRYLKENPEAKIQVAGTNSSARIAEDRAYGVQGALYELGISASRIEVLSGTRKGDGPVVVKIK